MKRSDQRAQMDESSMAPTKSSGTLKLFNTTHQPVPYTSPDGVTVLYVEPKGRVEIPASELNEELRTFIRTEILMEETSATE